MNIIIPLRDLTGLPLKAAEGGCLPRTCRGMRYLFSRLGLPVATTKYSGNTATAVNFSDLPPETQVAYLQRQAGVDPAGTNPALWEEFGQTTSKTISEAERRHTIICDTVEP